MDADRLSQQFRSLRQPRPGLRASTSRSPPSRSPTHPGTAYDSINYLWHADRFDDFLYLDRIASRSDFRRRGIASALYDAMEELAKAARPDGLRDLLRAAATIVSIAFHEARGYREVGHLMQSNGQETVMMEKPL